MKVHNVCSNDYDELIKKLSKRKKLLTILSTVIVLVTVILCSPIEIEIFNKTYVEHNGIHPVFTALLVLFIILCEFLVGGWLLSPLITSMTVECDPKKYLFINNALNKKADLSEVNSDAFLYMGDYEAALYFANNIIARKKPEIVWKGYFNKARCEFLLGDFEALKLTTKQYETSVANIKRKNIAVYEVMQNILNLLVAIAENDKEKITALKNFEAWNNSKALEGYINYLKGVAAFVLEDKEEAIYRFMAVKDNCEKTVFATLAEEYLQKLK